MYSINYLPIQKTQKQNKKTYVNWNTIAIYTHWEAVNEFISPTQPLKSVTLFYFVHCMTRWVFDFFVIACISTHTTHPSTQTHHLLVFLYVFLGADNDVRPPPSASSSTTQADGYMAILQISSDWDRPKRGDDIYLPKVYFKRKRNKKKEQNCLEILWMPIFIYLFNYLFIFND